MGRKARIKREKLLFSLVENLKEALKLQNGVARNWALVGIRQSFPQFTDEEIDSIIEKIPQSEPKIKGGSVSLKIEQGVIVGVYF